MRRRVFLAGPFAAPALAKGALDSVQQLHRDRLAAFGTWHELAPLGRVWRPEDLPPGWRPFGSGRWRYTFEAGWYWQGRLPFSGIAEHRGRWARHARAWWWLPGARFEPAPVAWGRSAAAKVAWAPLPGRGQQAQGWSMFGRTKSADDQPSILPVPEDQHIRRTAPPDPGEIAAVTGQPVEPVPLSSLVGADDLAAWRATGQRTVRGIGDLALRLPRPRAKPDISGSAPADDAWSSFERQRQFELRQRERLRELDRRRARDELP